jgi:beta-mannanase
MIGELSNTYSGMNDGNIEKLGRWLSGISSPVFLRIGYECDGTHNKYGPAEYVKAYRHIVDKLRAENVTNTAFVWHVHAHKSNPDLNSFYPGDSYADWVGISYFDQPESMITPVLDFAKARQKPVMVAEGTPKGIGSVKGRESWEKWYGKFFDFVIRNDIKAVSYINSDWDSQKMWKTEDWKNAKVEADAYVLSHWIKEVSGSRFIRYSPSLSAYSGR